MTKNGLLWCHLSLNDVIYHQFYIINILVNLWWSFLRLICENSSSYTNECTNIVKPFFRVEICASEKKADISKIRDKKNFFVMYWKPDSYLPKNFIIIWFNNSPSKMMKNAFYFILKALFVLKISKFLSWLFEHAEKTAWLEI